MNLRKEQFKKVHICGEHIIEYALEYKNVKNVNLRIKRDGSVCVSANRSVPKSIIDSFVISKADFIFAAKERYKTISESKSIQIFDNDELRTVIHSICERIYPYYQRHNIPYPTIKFRKMVSRWGSCCPGKNTVTFNTMLVFASYDCIEYVIFHEFTHFLFPDHSKKFYTELESVCPDWKKKREKLREINLETT